jgi:hypothetical protein
VILSEIVALESKRRSAEDRMTQLVRQDRKRRLTAEAADAETERLRAEHVSHARDLQARRVKAGAAVDDALAAFASALADWHQTARHEADELVRAGERQAADVALPKARCINAAMRHALIRTDVHSSAIELPFLSGGRIESPTEGDSVAIEPTETKTNTKS